MSYDRFYNTTLQRGIFKRDYFVVIILAQNCMLKSCMAMQDNALLVTKYRYSLQNGEGL